MKKVVLVDPKEKSVTVWKHGQLYIPHGVQRVWGLPEEAVQKGDVTYDAFWDEGEECLCFKFSTSRENRLRRRVTKCGGANKGALATIKFFFDYMRKEPPLSPTDLPVLPPKNGLMRVSMRDILRHKLEV